MRCLLLIALLACTAPTTAAERTLTVTDFDGVRVEGPFVVTVTTGRGTAGKLIGDLRALDHVRVDIESGTAVIRATEDANDARPAKVALITRTLARASVAGSGTLTIDKMAGLDVRISLDGSGLVTVGAMTADQLLAMSKGTGTMTLAGTVKAATIDAKGSGALDATRLIIADAKISLDGSGTLSATAMREANIGAKGTGTATIYGKAACAVKREGAVTVLCGKVAGQPAAATPALASATLPRVQVGVPPSLRQMRQAGRP
jgi:hypothetical protein